VRVFFERRGRRQTLEPREPAKSAQQLASGLGGAHKLANGSQPQAVYTAPGFAATTRTHHHNTQTEPNPVAPPNPAATAPASPRRSSVSTGLPRALPRPQGRCLARTRTVLSLPRVSPLPLHTYASPSTRMQI
jgi:hypothetical protein